MLLTGADCVVLKGGRRLCGVGAALANAPLVQNKSYFEVKIQASGRFVLCTPYAMFSVSFPLKVME